MRIYPTPVKARAKGTCLQAFFILMDISCSGKGQGRGDLFTAPFISWEDDDTKDVRL